MKALNAIVTRRIDVATNLWILYVAPVGWELPWFEAGQYATLGLPAEPSAGTDRPTRPLLERDYSIASSPNERDHLEFYLVHVPEGDLSPRLYALHEGDALWVDDRIRGGFLMNRAPSTVNLLLIATGTGIAPYISMLRTSLAADFERRIAVFHGVRHSTDFGYMEELRSMERLCPHFSYFPIISRPGDERAPWLGRTGYVQDLWKGGVLTSRWHLAPDPENTHIFLCGSPAMIDDMIQLLRGDGFVEYDGKRGQIHTEKYW